MTGQKAPFQFSMVTKGRDHRHPSPWHKLCLCPTTTPPPTPAPVLIKTAMRMQTGQLVCPRSPVAHGGAGKTRYSRVELRAWSLVTSWLGENGMWGRTRYREALEVRHCLRWEGAARPPVLGLVLQQQPSPECYFPSAPTGRGVMRGPCWTRWQMR